MPAQFLQSFRIFSWERTVRRRNGNDFIDVATTIDEFHEGKLHCIERKSPVASNELVANKAAAIAEFRSEPLEVPCGPVDQVTRGWAAGMASGEEVAAVAGVDAFHCRPLRLVGEFGKSIEESIVPVGRRVIGGFQKPFLEDQASAVDEFKALIDGVGAITTMKKGVDQSSIERKVRAIVRDALGCPGGSDPSASRTIATDASSR